MAETRSGEASPDALVVLCWEGGPDSGVARHPVARRYAGALADALGRSFPSRKYWVEELPAVPRQGRVRRMRSRPRQAD